MLDLEVKISFLLCFNTLEIQIGELKSDNTVKKSIFLICGMILFIFD